MDFEEEINQLEVKKQENQKKRDEQSRFFIALSKVLNTSEGRIVFHHILNLAPYDERNFTSDPCLNAFQQGRKDVILEIIQILKNNFNLDMIKAIHEEKL